MARIKVNWGQLNDLGKRTIENKDAFETSRARLQELVDELMNYWKGQDAENYHERATDFFEYLKNETNHMEKWGKYFDKASNNYKSGVEEGLKNIKQTNAMIEEAIVNPESALVSDDMSYVSSGVNVGEHFNFADGGDASNGIIPHSDSDPISYIPELNNPVNGGSN